MRKSVFTLATRAVRGNVGLFSTGKSAPGFEKLLAKAARAPGTYPTGFFGGDA